MPIFQRMLSLMLKPWAIIMAIVFIALAYFYLDKDIALYCHNHILHERLPILKFITLFGNIRFFLVALPIFALISSYILHKKPLALKAWMLWVMVLFPGIINFILKIAIGRARPIGLIENKLFGFYGPGFEHKFQSFPSGNTETITSLMIGFLILYPKYYYWYFAAIFLVAASRVLLTFHYLSDVLATFYLVVLELGLLFFIVKKKYPNIYGTVFK
jgi:membrane-associated phospholipid phosphatase